MPADARPALLGPLLRQRPVQWFFASVFFHVLAHMSLYLYFSLYLDSLGYGKGWIGALWAVSVVAEVIWFFTQGRWLPRCSVGGWLLLCAMATALRMGLTALFGAQLWLLLLLQCLHAWTFAAHHSVCIEWLSTHFSGRFRGRGQALYTVLGYGVTGVLAGFAGGHLSHQLGLASVFMAATASALMAALAAYRVWRASPVQRAGSD
jgi:MFS transporter, PPP family, 3-phenylpropionic acid transporter